MEKNPGRRTTLAAGVLFAVASLVSLVVTTAVVDATEVDSRSGGRLSLRLAAGTVRRMETRIVSEGTLGDGSTVRAEEIYVTESHVESVDAAGRMAVVSRVLERRRATDHGGEERVLDSRTPEELPSGLRGLEAFTLAMVGHRMSHVVTPRGSVLSVRSVDPLPPAVERYQRLLARAPGPADPDGPSGDDGAAGFQDHFARLLDTRYWERFAVIFPQEPVTVGSEWTESRQVASPFSFGLREELRTAVLDMGGKDRPLRLSVDAGGTLDGPPGLSRHARLVRYRRTAELDLDPVPRAVQRGSTRMEAEVALHAPPEKATDPPAPEKRIEMRIDITTRIVE